MIVPPQAAALSEAPEEVLDPVTVAVAAGLVTLRRTLKGAPERIDKETRDTWVRLIRKKTREPAVIVAAFEAALERLTFWPMPAELLPIVKECATDHRIERVKAYVPCQDDQGREYVAPPEQVHGCLLVPPERALPPRSEGLEAMFRADALKMPEFETKRVVNGRNGPELRREENG